jgi:N-acetylmuramoyl-L-alanine amidase.
MNFNIDNTFCVRNLWRFISTNSQQIYVLHETTNIGAKANASYFKNNWSTSQTYVQYVIGDGGKIYRVGADGYEAWGAGSYANANSPVQIELARTTDKATFKKDYEVFVNFARAKAQEFGIPTTLDAYGNGIKTHKWISDNIWGSHTDPFKVI